jgi:hypothetical protein
MKQITFSFDPFEVKIGGKLYKNISASSAKRLDETLVAFCKNGQMKMNLLADFRGSRILVFEPVKKD